MSEAAVREGFAWQAAISARAGAPFTGRIAGLIGERLDRSSALGRRILDWPGEASHIGDAVPLRLIGGLHALVRSGAAPDLAAVYPPNAAPDDDDRLWRLIDDALHAQGAGLAPWLDGPPQTNEVGRSGPLMAALLVLADRFDLPFRLFELGASAALNSRLDRYAYDLGGVGAGDPASAVRIAPRWTGAPPPSAKVEIVGRRAVDRAPLDPADPATRDRLAANVWADQRDRLARLEAALDLAAAHPLTVERGDAAEWLETVLSPEPEPGVCRVVMHTIAFQYFGAEAQERIRRHLAALGARATKAAPLAWVSFEAASGGDERRPELVLTVWPGWEATRLAVCQPHGAEIDWLA